MQAQVSCHLLYRCVVDVWAMFTKYVPGTQYCGVMANVCTKCSVYVHVLTLDVCRGRQTFLLHGPASQKVVTCTPYISFLFSYCVTCIPSLASHPIHHVHGPLYWHRIRDSALRDIGHSSLFVDAGQISHVTSGGKCEEVWEWGINIIIEHPTT